MLRTNEKQRIADITGKTKAIAINLHKYHEEGEAVPHIRQALIWLHQIFQEQSQTFTPEQAQIIAAYHRIAVATYKIFKTTQ
jgi:hypothetical protein